jgi:hypothetical protein
LKLFGSTMLDIYLNEKVYWKSVPEKVWNTVIGGYQVIKKLLSYREYEITGRAMTIDEVREVTNIARRIAAIILMYPSLDENYERIKLNVEHWVG